MSIWQKLFGVKKSPNAAIAKRLNQIFKGEMHKFNSALTGKRTMLRAVRTLDAAFRQTIPTVAEMWVKTASEQKSQQHVLNWENLKLSVGTIPNSIENAWEYFNHPTGYAGYGKRVDHVRGDPAHPKDNNAQLFADIIIVVDVLDGRERSAIHILLLPNGTKDEEHCPISIWPVGLLNSRERQILGL